MDDPIIKKELYFFYLESGFSYEEGWVDFGDGIIAWALKEVQIVKVQYNKYKDSFLKLRDIPVCVMGDTRTEANKSNTEIEKKNTDTDVEAASSKDVTPLDVGFEWLTGTGPKHRDFTDGDVFTEMLKRHEHILSVKASIPNEIKTGKIGGSAPYELNGVQGIGKYVKDYSTLTTLGATGNLAVTFLGSYKLQWKVISMNEDSVTVLFTVENSSTIQSATRPPVIGYFQWWQNSVGSWIDKTFQDGPMSPKTQTFKWTEKLKW